MNTINESNTKTKDYSATIQAHVSSSEAFEKIARVGDWWAKSFKGKAKKLNDEFTVRFGETFVDFRITEAIPDKKIVWAVTDCWLHWLHDKKEWMDTRVVWEISLKKNAVQINMTHVGLLPEVECYKDCKKGWDGHVKGSLMALLMEGKGRPE
ncbi:MAG: SRPBCC domain-containing protein [Chitinophagales bacterium]